MTNPNSRLFRPLKVGNISLQHRIVMAPLTRFRADDDHVPLPLMTVYYAQRASVPGTLLITEATFISPRAGGYANVPGIWNSAQVDGWRAVTNAVYAKGSYIFLQLWALGRAADPTQSKREGIEIVSASATAIDSHHATAKEMTHEDIRQYVSDYKHAARNAMAAGFDGVELHCANGFLPDQFIKDVTNLRDDEYGGTVAKRARFPLEVARAVIDGVGGDSGRVGVRFSPWSDFQGMHMDDPVPQFSHVVSEMGKLGLGYCHLVESRAAIVTAEPGGESVHKLTFAVEAWKSGNRERDKNGQTGPVLIAGGLTPELAQHTVDEEHKDDDNIAVVFGRFFISTPDLPFRLRKGIELNPYNRDTFYTAKAKEGYVDYPFSKEFLSEMGNDIAGVRSEVAVKA